jgi:hypothetical protein
MTTWRTDPALQGRFHAELVDDLLVMVHDGEPRRTQRAPEACFVRVTGVAGVLRMPHAPPDAVPPVPASALRWTEQPIYRGTLLNAPRNLTTVRQHQPIELIAARGLPYPLQITPQYAQERGRWCIAPCTGCGGDQALDPMTTMARTRFPDTPSGSSPIAFSANCPCGGRMVLAMAEVPSAGAAPDAAKRREAPGPARASTRWSWLRVDGRRALVFHYVDPSAGPSAKGALVDDPPTEPQIRDAIDHPSATFRGPAGRDAIAIGAEEALRLGLPKDPPWIGLFEHKPVPPPRGEPSRAVIAVVTRNGKAVGGAEVRLGRTLGAARELIAVDTRTSDAEGRCVFPLAEVAPLSIVATTAIAGSKIVDVPADRDLVEVPLFELGALEGRITKQGAPVAGAVSLTGRDGGVHRVRSSDAAGAYRIDGVVPGEYDVRVDGIDPSNHMTAGTPTFDRVVVPERRLVRRDFALVAGTRLEVVLRVEHDTHNGRVYLIAGEVAAQAVPTSSELNALVNRLDKTAWRSANSSTNTGAQMWTQFLDVPPGVYTLCIYRGTTCRIGIPSSR